jgi:plastocyanin
LHWVPLAVEPPRSARRAITHEPARYPSTLTVVEGDTIHLTLINPEDDVHSFVLPDFAVSLPGNKTIDTTYVAAHAGIFPIVCAIQAHLPMMSGQLVVLPAATMAGADKASARTTNGR